MANRNMDQAGSAADLKANSSQKFERWAASFAQKVSLKILSNAVIGIEASYYLEMKLNGGFTEPLLRAIGGYPYNLRNRLVKDLERLKSNDIKVIFVFDGLDFVNKRAQAGTRGSASVPMHENGWRHYQQSESENTAKSFAKAHYAVQNVYLYFQKLLAELEVEYIVAPYSAAAQLVYFSQQQEQFIDLIMGSSDCFLFNVERILSWLDEDEDTFDCTTKSECQRRLGGATDEVLRDCQLLLGSSFLPMFPPLARIAQASKPTPRDALNLLMNSNRSVFQLCHQFRDDGQVQNLQYRERYMRAIMTIKHHVILESDGTIAPTDLEHAPGDVHEFVGQRLPDELFFYLSKGIIGPEILNCLTSGEIVLTLPAGVQDNSAYRQLVVDRLNDIRTLSLKLLGESLNRYYGTRIINLKVWYERDTSNLAINIRDVPSLREKMATWKIKESAGWPPSITKPQAEQKYSALMEVLKDQEWVEHTIPKPGPEARPILKTRREVCFNVFWRFLRARDYVNDQHELTTWGKTLLATMTALEDDDNADEIAIIAVELLRLNAINGNDFEGRTLDKDKSMTTLICRVACVGRLQHEAKGYSGPLDRQLLCFAWMITAVRTALRDLIETILVSMFLNGDAVRDRDDWIELSHSLPFLYDNGCGLGIAFRAYCDHVVIAEHQKDTDPDEAKTLIRKQIDPFRWFPDTEDYEKSIELCLRIWDALYAGVQTAGKDIRDAKTFKDADDWLKQKR